MSRLRENVKKEERNNRDTDSEINDNEGRKERSGGQKGMRNIGRTIKSNSKLQEELMQLGKEKQTSQKEMLLEGEGKCRKRKK